MTKSAYGTSDDGELKGATPTAFRRDAETRGPQAPVADRCQCKTSYRAAPGVGNELVCNGCWHGLHGPGRCREGGERENMREVFGRC